VTVLEHRPSKDEILDFINDGIRRLQEDGVEARFVVMGPAAYDTFRHAMAERFRREPRMFETYNYVALVVDPFRTDEVCVLPAPAECARGVEAYRVS